MRLEPITFRAACAFVAALHRHNKPPRGHKFSIGLRDGERLVGVVMCGRPVARGFDDGLTLEVARTCTDGTLNANSMLYGAAWRAAKAMGYRRCVTYTQADETGASLRAAGWRRVRELTPRGSWGESTRDVRLVAMRDPVGTGGVARVLWETGQRETGIMDMKTTTKSEEKMDRISVRIPADLKARLETAAKAKGVSLTDVILAALEAAVEKPRETAAEIDVFS